MDDCSPDGNSGISSQIQPLSKWPIKPGVQVHLNALNGAGFNIPTAQPHTIVVAQQQQQQQAEPPSQSSASVAAKSEERECEHDRDEEEDDLGLDDKCEVKKTPSRKKLIRKAPQKTLELLATGVVTFRRSSGESAPSGTGRKRKKPGDDGSTGGKGEDDWPGEKLFYENLPFHGLQAPPNKIEPEPEPQNPLPPAATPPAPTLSGGNGSRPPSELSQNGSSGYGSTRSQSDHPPQVTQVLGFGSLRARKNTGASFLSARALLFSSLRFPSKTRNDNQIQSHADLQGVAEDSELGIPIVPYNPRENETEGAVAPPRAAPRAPRARHVYLNVPFPQPLGAEENSDQHQRHRHHEGGLSTLSLSRMATLPVQQKFPAVHHPPPPPPARLIRPPSHLPDEYVEVAYASPYPVLPRPVADNIPRSSQGLRHPRSSGVKVKDNLYPGKRGANPTPAALHFRESGLGQEIDV